MTLRLRNLILALACALTGAFAAPAAQAQIEINVNRADVQPLPIAWVSPLLMIVFAS